MYRATTHTSAKGAILGQRAALRRLGPRAFAALVAAELLLLLGVLVWALLVLLPPATPLASSDDLTPVREAIRARIGGAHPDPLVPVAAGHTARASNLRGFSLGGTTYYYYIEGDRNYDPLSRGAVAPSDVEVLLRDESGPRTIVIYRIL